MSFEVLLTDDAARDLEEICDYIDRHDSPARADYVLERIEKAFQGLSSILGAEATRGNCSTSGSGTTGKSSSSPTASSIG